MTKRSLLYFIKQFEASKELIRITTPVSTDLEITEIVDRVVKSEKQNKALLFENNGTKFPLLINLFGNEKR
ncbi:MAG TPA: menaquinone biosynthesis decarboxylase, partial [Bacteroidales bacterium]|nr:menaquinone biosynthesis decarboxylase [Bacteroidales bacterium]